MFNKEETAELGMPWYVECLDRCECKYFPKLQLKCGILWGGKIFWFKCERCNIEAEKSNNIGVAISNWNKKIREAKCNYEILEYLNI
jgi:hypothetical protein